jgi:NAD(P)-dependent dehydrogenase (short-subunit alcohol dehydrogenase family)
LITGGSKGIGLACARAFLDEGANVAIVSRESGNLDRAAAQLRKVTLIAADLSRAEDAQRMAREAEAAIGPIDVLVNSAGAAKRYPPDELNAQAWHAAMDAKYFTYIHAMDAVASMRDRGAVRGRIIGTGGKVATPVTCPAVLPTRADACLRGARQRLRKVRGAHQCHQSGCDHDRQDREGSRSRRKRRVLRSTRCSKTDSRGCRWAATRIRRTSRGLRCFWLPTLRLK